MIVAGIIAEYNPFHNGHKYQLEQIRNKTNADYIIVAMSGNFLQRGVPAVIDKYARTKLALSQGADLVIEIPVLWATASAEYYAKAGVTLLKNTGVVDYLCFGAECGELSYLKQITHILDSNSETYQSYLQKELKLGSSFPLARMRALKQLLPPNESSKDSLASSLEMQLSSPNNILAIEYLRALSSTDTSNEIEPCLIQRIGNGYHEEQLGSFASATAIRKVMFSCPDSASLLDSLQDYLTPEVLTQLKTYGDTYGFVSEDALSSILGYQLYSYCKEGYTSFADCSFELSHRIQNQLSHYEGFTQFCNLLKTKDMTYTRISRTLLHILLHITNEAYEHGKALGMVPYLRVLGFQRNAIPLLHEIKLESKVPMITKLCKADSQLNASEKLMLEKDIFASNIYNQLILANKKSVPKNDYSQELILL